MTKTYRFVVTGPNCKGTRSVISRHETLKAARRAAARGTEEFKVEQIVPVSVDVKFAALRAALA